VYVELLSLRNFRNYREVELAPARDGVTLLRGDNGAGKTNLLEAVYYVGNLRSFRGATVSSLVRSGDAHAVVRTTANREGRALLVEIELRVEGRDKLRLNRQAVRRSEDLLGTVLVTIFSPDDIEMVKGSPGSRRAFLDQLVIALQPKYGAVIGELERVLRQRNALLRSAAGAMRPGLARTLDVWDAKLASAGEQIVAAREAVVGSLALEARAAYGALSGSTGGRAGLPAEVVGISLAYQQSWDGTLLAALQGARSEDVRRGLTTVGPQRDDLLLAIGGLGARAQASQGEQRSFALALRLAGHRLVTARQGSSPILLLDDIFSELDPWRSAALARCLPSGQTLLTTAGAVPAELPVARTFLVQEGAVRLGAAGPS